jgi:hypothetical protein
MLKSLTIELSELLTAETVAKLQAEAARQQIAVSALVMAAIETYLDEEPLEDTPDEQILADFRAAWLDMKAGAPVPRVKCWKKSAKNWRSMTIKVETAPVFDRHFKWLSRKYPLVVILKTGKKWVFEAGILKAVVESGNDH